MEWSKISFLCSCVILLAASLTGCGGGSSSSPPPVWSVTMSNVPAKFGTGGVGEYSMTISNSGSGPSRGTVTATDTLPSGLTASNIGGNGWTCTLSAVSCSRSDALPVGSSYDPIIMTVNVAQNAPGSVTNQATVSGGGAVSSASAQDVTQIGPNGSKINHVVVIFQENRTPDNLFHDPVLMNRGADIASTGQTSTGQTVTLTPVPLVTDYDLGHSHNAFLQACQWNGTQCMINGANLVPCNPQANCPSNPQYQYVQASDVQPYFTMAETYTFGDRMFQTNEGPSFPAHQYILSGTSAVCVQGGTCPGGTTSTFDVADNPSSNDRPDGTYWAGCLAPPNSTLDVIDTSQPFPNNDLPQITGTLSECFEHATLTDVLDAQTPPLTWKYYAALPGSIWTAPDAIEHMCVPKSADGKYDDTVCNGSDWTAVSPNVVIEGSNAQVVTDIGHGKLAAVTWVIPDGASSDHASGNQGLGPSWVASIVNAIGQSAFWSDTAIIVTWDDWGGWYDHVAPPIHNGNSYEYGFRVPLIAISPYAKPAYVSHQHNDFGGILRFIEETFGLGLIGSGDYADSHALGDLSDCFDYSQTPLTFTPIPAAHDAKFFVNNTAEPTPPDND